MSTPVLWHILVSHYSEKVRWALDLKGVEHERKAPMPPAHMAVALALSRGKSNTFPILQIDGRVIGDSSEILAELEQRYPEPALFPKDPQDRKRAVELEDYFDEELAPATRLLVFHELRRSPETAQAFVGSLLPKPVAGNETVRNVAARGAATFAGVRYRVGAEEAATAAREQVLAGFNRLEAELAKGAGEFLVGDALSVADIAAACAFMPIVQPAEGPALPPPPAPYAAYMDTLRERPGFQWVEGTFARHRKDARRP